MKKFILAICMVVLSSSLVMARPMGGHHKAGHPRPPVKHHIIHSKPHHKDNHVVEGIDVNEFRSLKFQTISVKRLQPFNALIL